MARGSKPNPGFEPMLGSRGGVKAQRSKRNPRGGNQTEPQRLGLMADALRGFELVSIDGELAMLLRLGRRADEPVPELEKVARAFRVREPDQDTLGPFLASATRRVAGSRCRASPLYQRYRAWCEQHGFDRLSLVGFHRAMKARGFSQVVSNGHWWRDLAMIEDRPAGTLL